MSRLEHKMSLIILRRCMNTLMPNQLFQMIRSPFLSTLFRCYYRSGIFAPRRIFVFKQVQRHFARLDVSSCDHSLLEKEDIHYNLSHMSPQEIMVSYMRCPNCTGILSPPSSSHFMDILVPINAIKTSNFDLDLMLVKERFLSFQRYLHPDLIAFHLRNNQIAAEEQEERLEEWSVWINNAWETIRDPLKRAEHLIGVKESELEKMQTDPFTLMTAMQAREELDEDKKSVSHLKKENDERLRDTEGALSAAFRDKSNRAEIIKLIVKLKYWYSLRDAIKEKE